MDKRIARRNTILFIILCILIITLFAVYHYSSSVQQVGVDSDSRQQVISGGDQVDKSVQPQSNNLIPLLTDRTIFNAGMTDNEYQRTQEELSAALRKKYSGKYNMAAVKPQTVTYAGSDQTFHFTIRLGDEASSDEATVDIRRVRYNILHISAKNHADVIIEKEFKVNKSL